jgi:hypothetical protein
MAVNWAIVKWCAFVKAMTTDKFQSDFVSDLLRLKLKVNVQSVTFASVTLPHAHDAVTRWK